MQCRLGFIVQSLEDMSFLRADGEGGVESCHLYSRAMPFSNAESAFEAVEAHCGGRGAVVPVYLPVDGSSPFRRE